MPANYNQSVVAFSQDVVTRLDVLEAGTPDPADAVRFIWDTDIDSDIDDIAATALLLELIDEDSRYSLIAGTVASTSSGAPATLKACLEYGGWPNVPVGSYQGNSISSGSVYNNAVRDAFKPGENRGDFPEAVTVLRQALADSPDDSVRIVVGGTCTNIGALLQSPADGISSLTGKQLVAAKVQSISIMGGRFNGSTSTENNIVYDPDAANEVAANSPVPVIWAGWEAGGTVRTRYPAAGDIEQDPYAMAWNLGIPSMANAEGRRQSWDLVPCMYATVGLNGYYTLSEPQDVSFSADGRTTVTPSGTGNNRYLVKTGTDEALQTYFEGKINAFEIRRDTYGPLPQFPLSRSGAAGQTHTEALAGDGETATFSLVSGGNLGFSISGTTLTIPNFTYDANTPANNTKTATIRLTDTQGNTRDVAYNWTVTDAGGGGGGASLASLFLTADQGMWWDLSDQATLFQDIAGTVPVTADGQPVGKVLDKSGKANHWVASADNATRPTYRVDGNGNPYLEFSAGASTRLLAPAPFSKSPVAFTSCLGLLAASTGGGFALSASSVDSANPWIFAADNQSGSHRIRARQDNGGMTETPTIASVYDGASHRVISAQGVGNQIFRTRARDLSTNWTVDDSVGSLDPTTLTRSGLGCHAKSTLSDFWTGRIYSGFAISRQLSDTDLATVETWVAGRMGVTLS